MFVNRYLPYKELRKLANRIAAGKNIRLTHSSSSLTVNKEMAKTGLRKSYISAQR